MNSLEKIKDVALSSPESFVNWLETLNGENVKWKHTANVNQLVLRTDDYYYKIYEFSEIDKFNSIIRHAFAEVYQSYGIDWEIVTVKTEKGFLDIERREKLEICKEWSDDILLNYADTLNIVEKKLCFEDITKQIKEKYKYVSKLKLLRRCANKPIDYAVYKNKVILLDDADWIIYMLDYDYNPITTVNNMFVKVKIFDEYYTFTRCERNPQKSVTIDKVYELSDKFFLFKNIDIMREASILSRDFQNMLSDNIRILSSRDDKTSCLEEKFSICSPFKKTFYCTNKMEDIDFLVYNKLAIRHSDIINDRTLWDVACNEYVNQNFCGIYLYSSFYDSIEDLCELLNEAKLCKIEPINGYRDTTGLFLCVQWNIIKDNDSWEENFYYIKQHYPDIKILVNVILNEPFIQCVIKKDINITTFMHKYDALIQYGSVDDTPKESLPKRKSMLDFLNRYRYDQELYLKIFKYENGFEREINSCGHNKNNYLPYYDSEKCCICDWKIIGHLL